MKNLLINISSDESEKSKLKFLNHEQILSFTTYSYWDSEQVYIVYAKENDEWKRFKLTFKLDNKKEVRKSHVQKLVFNENKFGELLDFFNAQNFWTLQLDSLNLHSKLRDDGGSTHFSRADGVTDSFEIINGDQHRLISSYEAEYFQTLIPVKQRKRFINCKNEFLRLNKLRE